MNFYHLDASQYVVLPFWANGQSLITNHVFPLREVLCLAFLEKILFFLPPCPLRPLREALIFVPVVAPLYTHLCNLRDLIKSPPNSQKNGCW
jgi:hypothetical protein